ncbi:AlpA family phage regulatory protein [Geobacter hydrogenophilus]|uniref:Transcriptional regulator, AlpA family n=1 Tax=Geobacter hydrogenophilus TaxID=40983 RepID=A0A9W6LB63_9BACT|nr:AlpA family phage regulatory protein [Geobacter hydrogenophilus]MBT0893550.1 AlpA family phage regulatory protein [Geobacter hydrogenophilus]GLI37753.1 hypothetical protein GHYDROH2_12540 [Geobacter hydrogenophilus]
MSDKLLRLNQFIPDMLPISKSQWWEGVKSGKFPQPVKLGPRTTCWRKSDIERLVALGNTDTQ